MTKLCNPYDGAVTLELQTNGDPNTLINTWQVVKKDGIDVTNDNIFLTIEEENSVVSTVPSIDDLPSPLVEGKVVKVEEVIEPPVAPSVDSTGLDTAADSIEVDIAALEISTGDKISVEGNPELPNPLEPGVVYYAIVEDPAIKIATTEEAALAGLNVNLAGIVPNPITVTKILEETEEVAPEIVYFETFAVTKQWAVIDTDEPPSIPPEGEVETMTDLPKPGDVAEGSVYKVGNDTRYFAAGTDGYTEVFPDPAPDDAPEFDSEPEFPEVGNLGDIAQVGLEEPYEFKELTESGWVDTTDPGTAVIGIVTDINDLPAPSAGDAGKCASVNRIRWYRNMGTGWEQIPWDGTGQQPLYHYSVYYDDLPDTCIDEHDHVWRVIDRDPYEFYQCQGTEYVEALDPAPQSPDLIVDDISELPDSYNPGGIIQVGREETHIDYYLADGVNWNPVTVNDVTPPCEVQVQDAANLPPQDAGNAGQVAKLALTDLGLEGGGEAGTDFTWYTSDGTDWNETPDLDDPLFGVYADESDLPDAIIDGTIIKLPDETAQYVKSETVPGGWQQVEDPTVKTFLFVDPTYPTTYEEAGTLEQDGDELYFTTLTTKGGFSGISYNVDTEDQLPSNANDGEIARIGEGTQANYQTFADPAWEESINPAINGYVDNFNELPDADSVEIGELWQVGHDIYEATPQPPVATEIAIQFPESELSGSDVIEALTVPTDLSIYDVGKVYKVDTAYYLIEKPEAEWVEQFITFEIFGGTGEVGSTTQMSMSTKKAVGSGERDTVTISVDTTPKAQGVDFTDTVDDDAHLETRTTRRATSDGSYTAPVKTVQSHWKRANLGPKLPGPIQAIVDGADSLLGGVKPILETVRDILKLVKHFYANNVDPLAALLGAILDEIESIINDFFATGFYTLLISPTDQPYPVYDEYGIPRMSPSRAIDLAVKSFDDPGDENRPQFSDSAVVTCMALMISAADYIAFKNMICNLGKLLQLKQMEEFCGVMEEKIKARKRIRDCSSQMINYDRVDMSDSTLIVREECETGAPVSLAYGWGDTLPLPLESGPIYYVIYKSAVGKEREDHKIQLALTEEDASAGKAITFSNNINPNHFFFLYAADPRKSVLPDWISTKLDDYTPFGMVHDSLLQWVNMLRGYVTVANAAIADAIGMVEKKVEQFEEIIEQFEEIINFLKQSLYGVSILNVPVGAGGNKRLKFEIENINYSKLGIATHEYTYFVAFAAGGPAFLVQALENFKEFFK